MNPLLMFPRIPFDLNIFVYMSTRMATIQANNTLYIVKKKERKKPKRAKSEPAIRASFGKILPEGIGR